MAQFGFQRGLQHRDFEDANAPSGAAKAAPKQPGKPSEGLAKAFIQGIERSVDRRNQAGAEAIGAVGIEVDFEDVLPLGGADLGL